jgi:hypothetical protein
MSARSESRCALTDSITRTADRLSESPTRRLYGIMTKLESQRGPALLNGVTMFEVEQID